MAGLRPSGGFASTERRREGGDGDLIPAPLEVLSAMFLTSTISTRSPSGVSRGYSHTNVEPALKYVSERYQRTRSMGRLRAPASRKCAISALPRRTPSVCSRGWQAQEGSPIPRHGIKCNQSGAIPLARSTVPFRINARVIVAARISHRSVSVCWSLDSRGDHPPPVAIVASETVEMTLTLYPGDVL